MSYVQITDQVTGNVIPAAIPNQLQDNIEALKGGTPATAPTTTIEDLATDKIETSVLETTITDDDAKVPTSGAVVDYFATAGTLIGKPVGTYYWQPAEDDGTFTSANEPGTLFGGTWTRLWNGGDGEFPKAEGDTGGQTRTAGLQPDQFQGHYHNDLLLAVSTNTLGGANGPYYTLSAGSAGLISSPVTDGTNGTPRTGSKSESTNREFKLWERTA